MCWNPEKDQQPVLKPGVCSRSRGRPVWPHLVSPSQDPWLHFWPQPVFPDAQAQEGQLAWPEH